MFSQGPLVFSKATRHVSQLQKYDWKALVSSTYIKVFQINLLFVKHHILFLVWTHFSDTI